MRVFYEQSIFLTMMLFEAELVIFVKSHACRRVFYACTQAANLLQGFHYVEVFSQNSLNTAAHM